MLKWVIADPDSDNQDTFELESSGTPLSQLEYLAPNFKLVDEDPEFFDAYVDINGDEVNRGGFEWRAGTLSHKITEAIQDQHVKSVRMECIKHSSIVTSEALSVISKLPKPDSGFESINFQFVKLEAKLSETVVD